MLLTAPALTLVASCAVAAAFLTSVLFFTRAALARRSTNVTPAAVVLTASLVGGTMSLLALVLLSS
jgi:hypothetical protein